MYVSGRNRAVLTFVKDYLPIKRTIKAGLDSKRSVAVGQKIPIVDAHSNLMGWTAIPPHRAPGGSLRHVEAESLLRSRITRRMVTLTGENAAHAGAPLGLNDRWHCFAIAPDSAFPDASYEA